MTINVNNYEAERRLSWLLKQVANGERVVIWRDGHPIADLVPHSPVIIAGRTDQVAPKSHMATRPGDTTT